MGYWSCGQVLGVITPSDTDRSFGSDVFVSFKMTYHPSVTSRFVETPKLQWREIITLVDHNAKSYWNFDNDMYRTNPNSNTLLIWQQRYLAAYDSARNQPNTSLGSSRLLNKSGNPVYGTELAQAVDLKGKAAAIQDYLKRNGGSLLITVHDRPSIILSSSDGQGGQQGTQNKERLLQFRCSAGHGGQSFTGQQYLHVDGAKLKKDWERSENLSWTTSRLEIPTGYVPVQVPDHVSRQRVNLLGHGEVA
jgi:hypothetical protein